jgi:hypothetical protein
MFSPLVISPLSSLKFDGHKVFKLTTTPSIVGSQVQQGQRLEDQWRIYMGEDMCILQQIMIRKKAQKDCATYNNHVRRMA